MSELESAPLPAGSRARLPADAASERKAVPFEARLGLYLRPLHIGLLVAVGLYAGALLFRVIAARLGVDSAGVVPDLSFATRAALVASAGIGYFLGASSWIAAAAFRDLQDLGAADPEVDVDREPGRVLATPISRLRRSRWAGLAGILFFVSTIEVPNALAGATPFAPWLRLYPMTYMLGLGLMFFWIAGRGAYFAVGRGRMLDVEQGLELDLLDPRPLARLGRIALRGSLSWVIGFSIISLVFLNPELRFSQSMVVFGPVLLVTVAIASATLLLPLRILRRRIGAAKRAELEQVDAAIRGEPDSLVGSRLAARGGAESLADLIAYRRLIEAVPEWPFDASLLRRFGLYMLIPVFSWVGGALVERAVSSVLDR